MGKLEELKQEATKLGIEYPENVNYAQIKSLIKKFNEEKAKENEDKIAIADKEAEAERLEQLKAEANMMEVLYRSDVTADELADILQAESKRRQAKIDASKEESGSNDELEITMLKPGANVSIAPTEKDFEKVGIKRDMSKIDKARTLIRFIVVNMDPETQAEKSVYISVANAKYGNIATRTIPFGVPWHAEKAIVDTLMRKKYLYKEERTRETPSGKEDYIHTEYRQKYAIQLLSPLTEKELKQLADDQRKTERLKDN